MNIKSEIFRLKVLPTIPILVATTSLFSQCSSKDAFIVENQGSPAMDSLAMQCVDTIELHIGERIRPIPSSSQIIENESETKYAILDENRIALFDLLDDSTLTEIDLKECSPLKNYSGFQILNNDSIFVYNYSKKICYLTNWNGKVLNSQAIPEKLTKMISPEALSCTPPLHPDGKIIISGTPISHSVTNGEDPISISWDYKSHEMTPFASYSDEYTKAYFGGIYFNTIYQCCDDSDLIAYSFPASNNIYRYNSNLEFLDSLYMGSRYTSQIVSQNGNVLDFLSDKDRRLEYFLNQSSYGQVFFNPTTKQYYRIAEQPLDELDSDKQRKPFSIIVMDKNGHLLTETPILNIDRTLINANSHIYKDGLIIQLESEDENIIKFVYYKMH